MDPVRLRARAVFAETDGLRADDLRRAGTGCRRSSTCGGSTPTLPELTAGGADVTAEALAERARARRAADIATLIYTSGTTGRPKGCELTHENLLADGQERVHGAARLASTPTANASTLLFLPLAHVFARVIEVGTLEAGIVLGHCPDMNDLLPDLASFQPTFVLAVPRVFEKVYNGAEAKAAGEGKGKIFGRAAAIAVAYSEALRRRRARAAAAGRARPVRPAGLRQAAGRARRQRRAGRSPAARRSRRGSGTSSAASGSPSSRGTG